MTIELPFSQACENNQAPILEKLTEIFDEPGTVLEIGTGTGQHAVHFSQGMPHLQWQPTDHPNAAHVAIQRLQQASLPNILPIKAFDVNGPECPVTPFRWAFSANTAHIMAWYEVQQMFRHIGKNLNTEGAFCLYGPFNENGFYSSDSNRHFDQHLRARSPHMGIRDLSDLQKLSDSVGLSLSDNHDMPANNRLLVFSPL